MPNALSALAAIRAVPALAVEMARVITQVSAGRSPAATEALIAFREKAAKELSKQGISHNDSRTAIQNFFTTFANKRHGGVKGRPQRDRDIIEVPGTSSKNYTQANVGEVRTLDGVVGSRRQADTSPNVVGENAGKTTKRTYRDVPDDREIIAVQVDDTKSPRHGQWMLTRYVPKERSYRPISPAKGTPVEYFSSADDAAARAPEYFKPVKDLPVEAPPVVQGEALGYQRPSLGRGPVEHLMAKEAKEQKLRNPREHEQARGRNENDRHIEKKVREWEEEKTGRDAPRVESPFPDPRRSRYAGPLPKDNAKRVKTHEVISPVIEDVSETAKPRMGVRRKVETEPGSGVKSPFPANLNPNEKRFLVKVLPFLLGGGALAAGSDDSDE